MATETARTVAIITERAARLEISSGGMEETKWAISLCEIGNYSSCL